MDIIVFLDARLIASGSGGPVGWVSVELEFFPKERVMRNVIVAAMLVVLGAGVASAKEPISVSKLGLTGIKKMSDRQGSKVRGLAVRATASGLSSLGAVLYDPATASRVNLDLVNFSAAEDAMGCGPNVDTQNFNVIGLSPAFVFSVGDFTASIGAFSAGGSSQSIVNGGAASFLVPNPATNP
jgi:hypothetical protein